MSSSLACCWGWHNISSFSMYYRDLVNSSMVLASFVSSVSFFRKSSSFCSSGSILIIVDTTWSMLALKWLAISCSYCSCMFSLMKFFSLCSCSLSVQTLSGTISTKQFLQASCHYPLYSVMKLSGWKEWRRQLLSATTQLMIYYTIIHSYRQTLITPLIPDWYSMLITLN